MDAPLLRITDRLTIVSEQRALHLTSNLSTKERGRVYALRVPAVANSHHWYQLTWVDWITVAGLLLTLVGLYITWRQARNAANAAKAAQDAIIATERTIRSKQLMVLIPQLRWIVSELETAITTNDRKGARRQFDSWRWQASNIQGILTVADPEESAILRGLQESVSLARVAGAALLDEKSTIFSRASKARTSIVAVCDELNTWLGRNSTEAI